MVQASLLEQIKIFWNILINNQSLWLVLVLALGLVLLLAIGSKFHNKKITKILYVCAYLGIFGVLIGFFHTEILELYDYLVNNIFLFLFFPNLAVYALVLLIVNIIIIKSTFSNSDNKLIKIFNIIFFIIFNIIFYLIIDNVIKNSVNVYEQLSIYTNNDLLVLIELSMKLFVTWILILVIIKVSKSLAYGITLNKAIKKNPVKVELVNNKELESYNTFTKVMEIKPNLDLETIPEVPNKFNDYIEIEPIKKKKVEVLPQKIEQLEDFEPENDTLLSINDNKIEENVLVEEDKEDIKETLTEVINKVNPFDNINIVKVEDTKEDNMEEVKPITLSSYDSIFEDVNKKIENNMDVVFEKDNLTNIMSDIEELSNNIDDDNINKVYDKIIINQDELTLNDYNYLINELLTLKK